MLIRGNSQKQNNVKMSNLRMCKKTANYSIKKNRCAIYEARPMEPEAYHGGKSSTLCRELRDFNAGLCL